MKKMNFIWLLSITPLVPLTVASKCTTTKPVVPAQPETNEGIDKEGFLIKELQDKIKEMYEGKFTKSLFASENKDVNLEPYHDIDFDLEKPNIVAYNDVEDTLTVKVKGKYKSKPFNEFEFKLVDFKTYYDIRRFVSASAISAKLNLNKMIEDKIKWSDLILKENKELLNYISEFKAIGKYEELNLLDLLLNNNKYYELRNVKILKDGSTYYLNFTLIFKNYELKNGIESVSEDSLQFKNVIIENVEYTVQDIFNFLETKLVEKNLEEQKRKNFPSFFSARFQASRNLVNAANFLEFSDAKYANYFGFPIQFETINIAANDLTGSLYLKFNLKYEDGQSNEFKHNKAITYKIEGFKSNTNNKVLKNFFIMKKLDSNWNAIIKKIKDKYLVDNKNTIAKEELDNLINPAVKNIRVLKKESNNKYKLYTNNYLEILYEGVSLETSGYNEDNGLLELGSISSSNKIFIEYLTFDLAKITDIKIDEGKLSFKLHYNIIISLSQATNGYNKGTDFYENNVVLEVPIKEK